MEWAVVAQGVEPTTTDPCCEERDPRRADDRVSCPSSYRAGRRRQTFSPRILPPGRPRVESGVNRQRIRGTKTGQGRRGAPVPFFCWFRDMKSNLPLPTGHSLPGGDHQSPADARFLTIREAADLLRVSQSTIRNAIQSGQLAAHRFGLRGGSIRITLAALNAYVAACGTVAEPESPAAISGEVPGYRHLNPQRLLAAWQRQGVRAGRPGASNARSSGSKCGPSTRPAS